MQKKTKLVNNKSGKTTAEMLYVLIRNLSGIIGFICIVYIFWPATLGNSSNLNLERVEWQAQKLSEFITFSHNEYSHLTSCYTMLKLKNTAVYQDMDENKKYFYRLTNNKVEVFNFVDYKKYDETDTLQSLNTITPLSTYKLDFNITPASTDYIFSKAREMDRGLATNLIDDEKKEGSAMWTRKLLSLLFFPNEVQMKISQENYENPTQYQKDLKELKDNLEKTEETFQDIKNEKSRLDIALGENPETTPLKTPEEIQEILKQIEQLKKDVKTHEETFQGVDYLVFNPVTSEVFMVNQPENIYTVKNNLCIAQANANIRKEDLYEFNCGQYLPYSRADIIFKSGDYTFKWEKAKVVCYEGSRKMGCNGVLGDFNENKYEDFRKAIVKSVGDCSKIKGDLNLLTIDELEKINKEYSSTELFKQDKILEKDLDLYKSYNTMDWQDKGKNILGIGKVINGCDNLICKEIFISKDKTVYFYVNKINDILAKIKKSYEDNFLLEDDELKEKENLIKLNYFYRFNEFQLYKKDSELENYIYFNKQRVKFEKRESGDGRFYIFTIKIKEINYNVVLSEIQYNNIDIIK